MPLLATCAAGRSVEGSFIRSRTYFYFQIEGWDGRKQSDAPAKEEAADGIRMTTYADASYNCHSDSRSHYGICASMGGEGSGRIMAKSGKIATVCDSSAAAEISAYHKATQFTMWAKDFFSVIGRKVRHPVPMHGDSASGQAVCTKPTGTTKKLRHMLMRINFIMEQVKLNLIRMEKTPTRELCADMLTKAKGPTEFWINMPEMLGHSRAMEEMIRLVEEIDSEGRPMPMFRAKDITTRQPQQDQPKRKRKSVAERAPLIISMEEDDVDITGEEMSVCMTVTGTAGGGGPLEEPSAGEQRRGCSAAGGTAAGDKGSVEERAEEEAKRFRSASGGGGSVAAPTQVSPSQPPQPPPPPFPQAPTHYLGAIGEVVTAAVSAGVTGAVTAFQQGLQQGQQQVSSEGGATESRGRPPPSERFGEAVATMVAEAQQQEEHPPRKKSRRQCQKFQRGNCKQGDSCNFRHGN